MAGLKTYNAKRRFDVTAEPPGKASARRGHAFVIQKHAAMRLHYDLRLELDGVMKSWAVTRGPSLVPGEKRLAVEVEDHPIEYNKFEGTIPKGQYGGGTVMIWDKGAWQPEYDPHKGLQKGHLSFRLDGEKLQGGWHLVRMHRRPGEKRNNWLLIKQADDAARKPRDKDILEEMPRSVTTGRTMDEISQGAARRKPAKAKSAAKKPGKKKTLAKARTKKKSAALRAKEPVRRSKAGTALLPDFVEPALATLAGKAPASDGWIHEIKFDGYRLQARLDHGKVRLLTRRGLDWTGKFKAVAERVARLDAETALIDGELVSEDDKGVSSFSLLQQDIKTGRSDRMKFYAFDLLHLNGEDLRNLPVGDQDQVLRPPGVRGRWLRSLDGGSTGDRRPRARLLRGRQAALRRTRRHRLQPQSGARAVQAAEGVADRQAAIRCRSGGRARQERRALGRAQNGGRDRIPRLDPWRSRAAGIVPGRAGRQGGQRSGARA